LQPACGGGPLRTGEGGASEGVRQKASGGEGAENVQLATLGRLGCGEPPAITSEEASHLHEAWQAEEGSEDTWQAEGSEDGQRLDGTEKAGRVEQREEWRGAQQGEDGEERGVERSTAG
jgi:hypothetical protein